MIKRINSEQAGICPVAPRPASLRRIRGKQSARRSRAAWDTLSDERGGTPREREAAGAAYFDAVAVPRCFRAQSPCAMVRLTSRAF